MRYAGAGIVIAIMGVTAAIAHYWFARHWEDEMGGKTVGEWVQAFGLRKWNLILVCILSGWLFCLVMLWLGHDEKIKNGFEQKYDLCPKCEGIPRIGKYRPLWSPPDSYICEICKGTGFVPKDYDLPDS